MNAVHDGKIKGMYIMGENPAMSDPDQAHARAALAKLEHLVVQDIFLTETAWYADVVLPASAHAEKWGTFTNTNRQVQIGRPVLDPPGEARQDWELIQELARRVGLDWTYTHPREVFAEMAAVDAVARRTSPGSGWSARTRSPIPARRRTSRAARSSSRPASRRRAGAAASCRRTSRRPTSCRTRPIRWC